MRIDINDELLIKAQKLSGIKTKEVVVEEALRLYITIKNQNRLLELWGKIEIDDAP